MNAWCRLYGGTLLFLCAMWSLWQHTGGENTLPGRYYDSSDSTYCPDWSHNQTAELAWSLEPADVAYSCIGEYTELDCCAEGYDQIVWYQKHDSLQNEWQPVKYHYDKTLMNGNQSLRITNTERLRDEGVYRCHVTQTLGHSPTNTTSHIGNTVKLIVYECTDYSRPPLVMLPRETDVRLDLQSEASVVCQAFYGDCVESPCDMLWWRVSDSRRIPILNTNASHRIYVSQINSGFRYTGMTKVLHIENVTEGDMGRYQCAMISIHGNTTYDILLSQKVPVPPHQQGARKYLMVIIGGVSLGLVLLGIVGVPLLVWRYGHTSRLRRQENNRKMPTEAREYDVTVVSAEVDEVLNRQVCDTLRGQGHSVYDYTQIEEGKDHFQKLPGVFDKSVCVLFLVTPHLLAEPAIINLFHLTHRTPAIYRVFIDCLHTAEETQMGGEEAAPPRDLATLLKVGRSVAWDSQNQQQFWEKLSVYLPDPQRGLVAAAVSGRSVREGVGALRESHSEGRPLLHSWGSEGGNEWEQQEMPCYHDNAPSRSMSKSGESGYSSYKSEGSTG